MRVLQKTKLLPKLAIEPGALGFANFIVKHNFGEILSLKSKHYARSITHLLMIQPCKD